MSDTIAPVLIAGSGPSGLVAALSLRMNGVPVRIIEKKPAYPVGQRGAGIQPRTLEVHHFFGTLGDIQSLGSPLQRIKIFDVAPRGDKALKELDISQQVEPTSDIPYSNPCMLGQAQQEDILRKRLAAYDCQVELNTELRAFEQHDHYVAVTIAKHCADGQEVVENLKYRWLIGADGARSVVRKASGFSFLGETRSGDNFVFGDIHVPNVDETLTKTYWCMWGDMKTKALIFRPTTDRDVANFVISGPEVKDWTCPPLGREDFLKTFIEMTGRTDVQFGDLIWMGNYKPNIRMVEKFGEGRVYLVGDAAHVHSPTGGQGLNSSVQDSFNLGWKLALVERGLASQLLLQTYTEERIPVIAEMLELTTVLLNKTRQNLDEAWNRGSELHMLGVNYRTSSIVLDERCNGSSNEYQSHYVIPKGQAVQAGDRAPDAPGLIRQNGQETRLFDIFGPTHHTVLVFSYDSTLIIETLGKYPQGSVASVIITPSGANAGDSAVTDRDGHATTAYSINANKSTIVVVRPDGIIGAITFNVDGLKRYFEKIFI